MQSISTALVPQNYFGNQAVPKEITLEKRPNINSQLIEEFIRFENYKSDPTNFSKQKFKRKMALKKWFLDILKIGLGVFLGQVFFISSLFFIISLIDSGVID